MTEERAVYIRHVRTFSAGIQANIANGDGMDSRKSGNDGRKRGLHPSCPHVFSGHPGASRKCRETGGLDSRFCGNDREESVGMTEESAVYIRHARTFSAGIQANIANGDGMDSRKSGNDGRKRGNDGRKRGNDGRKRGNDRYIG
ncbi:MAG: hypothetical protein LBU39_10895 [Desulfobulbaceae bacterium]|nr:hypothetical protein [Desulfobulbaceae bacterium]